jgi:hypothetical protein
LDAQSPSHRLLAQTPITGCDSNTARPRLDLTEVALVSAALLLLLYPLVQGHDAGWPTWTFVSMAAALPVLVLFAVQQARKAGRGGSPLVPPALFHERAFTGGVLAALTFFSGVVSFFLVLTLTLQLGLGFSPLHTALTFAPWSLALAAAAGASVQLAPRLGRRLTTAGALLMAVLASEGFVQALRDSLWFELAVYLLSALALLLLPKQAIATYGEPSLEQATVES